ncbi:MAG: hypothetical protein HYX68_10815 [Planctomycetes bacterium]|nr:hypothetical protein [Planctomycetota bacterium]
MDTVDFTLTQDGATQCLTQQRCPICGGALIEIRTESRCCQCFFRICDGCDGAHEPDG